ncbi:hypothetical protein HY947_01975 [Candidatus Gottesmanbacteria bacterium]|nr:hypothetical protein [Candidatus Gottesmanbacteria bacterium]
MHILFWKKNPGFKREFKRWDRHVVLSKRQEFVFTTVLLTLGLILTQLVPVELRFIMVGALSIFAYCVSAIVLRDDLDGVEWFTLLVLPTLFTAGVTLFYFLLPARWITRVPVAVLYAIGMYALFLTENIYNVNSASNRAIALIRAAHSVGFILTLVSYYFILQATFAFRFPVILLTLVVGIISYILSLQALWAIELTGTISRRVYEISFSIAIILSMFAWTFSFWPVKLTQIVLLLSTVFYSTVGLGQQYLVERLYKKTATEFFIVSTIVLGIILLSTRFRGPV